MMHGHMFGAYFGLLVAWCLSRSLPSGVDEKVQTEKVQMATGSSLFAMLGKDKSAGGSPVSSC